MDSLQFALLLLKPRSFSVTLVQSTNLLFKINVHLTKLTFPSLMHPLGGPPWRSGHVEVLRAVLLWRSVEAGRGVGNLQGIFQVMETAEWCLLFFQATIAPVKCVSA